MRHTDTQYRLTFDVTGEPITDVPYGTTRCVPTSAVVRVDVGADGPYASKIDVSGSRAKKDDMPGGQAATLTYFMGGLYDRRDSRPEWINVLGDEAAHIVQGYLG